MPNYNTNSFFNDSSATNGTSSDSTSIIGTIDVVFVKAILCTSASLFFMFCVLAACRECRCKREPRIKDSDVYRELEQQGPGVL